MDSGLKPWKTQRCSLSTMTALQARAHEFPSGGKLILALDKTTIENYKLHGVCVCRIQYIRGWLAEISPKTELLFSELNYSKTIHF